MEKWAQPGTGNHWRKLGSLVEHVDALALYIWEMTRHAAWDTSVWALQEFLEANVEDWMCVSAYLAPDFRRPAVAPPGWQQLSWHTDHMRRRAQGMRPGERGMAEVDRVLYAEYIRSTYRQAGIEARPW